MIKVDEGDLIRLIKDLVKIESVNPYVGGSGEAKINEFIASYLENIGLEVHTQYVIDDRFNVIGVLQGEVGDKTLMFNGHVDTVGIKGMAIAPFEPFIANGNLYGRGACDMKGPLAAMIAATQSLISSHVKLSGDLQISAVIDEEYLSRGTEKLLEEYHPNAAIVGEPTNLDIAVAHNGIVRLEIETFGKAAHGSVPEVGIDAISQMAKLILRLENLKKVYVNRRHALTGIPKLHTSMIKGGSEWNIVPDFCCLKVEIRTVPGQTSSMVTDEFRQIVEELRKDDPLFNAEIKLVLDKQPMEVCAQEAIVKSLQTAFREVKQTEPKITGEPYWTDASLFVNKAFIPTCIFAPGNINVAHSKDEYIKIDDAVDSAKIYALAAQKFLGSELSDISLK